MCKFHKITLVWVNIKKSLKKYFKIDQFSPLTLTLLALRYSSFFFSQTCKLSLSLSLSLSLIISSSSGRWIKPTIEAHIIKYPKKLWIAPTPSWGCFSVAIHLLWVWLGFLNLLLPVWSVVACSSLVDGFC